MEMRVGQGFDIHGFSDDHGRTLVLAGVEFPGERGLAGHSDADVVTHAVIDALLGAAGMGDIGEHFPDTDPDLAGADSIALLRTTRSLLEAEEWGVVNIDCTVVADRPRLAPRRAEMCARLEEVVGAPVTVKGKTTEGVGSLGRGEGIVALAVVLLSRSVAR